MNVELSRETRHCTVLVVDDHADTAASMAALVRLLGHEAIALTNALEVADAVEAHRPDLVFLDIGMPGANGWEVATELRRTYPPGDLYLVAITAYGSDDDRVRSRNSGFDAHLVKPVDINVVERILSHFMGC